MKSLQKHGGHRKTGFTLIELLTVIVIIGVLVGMISTAVMMAKRKAMDVARDVDLKTIKSAIEAYRFEYQEWPCPAITQYPRPPSVTYQSNNGEVINDWLMNTNAADKRNERGIKFLNLGDYRRDSFSNLVDYAGNKYKITFDFDNDTVKVE